MPKVLKRKKWKAVYDDLITAMLSGKTHREAAAAVGIHDTTVSRLMRWPTFMGEYRRRRAVKVEESDAWIQAASNVAAARLLEILNLNRPMVIEYENAKGVKKKITIKPNFHLVQSTAIEVLRAGRERTDRDIIVQGIEELKKKAKNRLSKE
jgi:hypothetical protein